MTAATWIAVIASQFLLVTIGGIAVVAFDERDLPVVVLAAVSAVTTVAGVVVDIAAGDSFAGAVLAAAGGLSAVAATWVSRRHRSRLDRLRAAVQRDVDAVRRHVMDDDDRTWP